MCWSLPVSLLFAVIDFACVAYLFKRNRGNDRWYCVMFFPIAFQEACQVVLWATIGEDPKMCSKTNVYVSFACKAIVGLIPLLSTLASTSKILGTPSGLGYLVAAIVFTVLLWSFIYVSFQRNPIGTIVGPHGHQFWPNYWLYYTFAGTLHNTFTAGYVFFSFGPLYMFFKPKATAVLIIAGVGLCFLVTRIRYPIEWESIWCWSGVICFLIALVEPLYLPFFQDKDAALKVL